MAHAQKPDFFLSWGIPVVYVTINKGYGTSNTTLVVFDVPYPLLTRFRLSAKQTSPFKSAGASVQSTTGSRGVRISGSNAGYTVFRGSVKGTGYPLHSLVSPSLPLPCVTVCHHISTGVYDNVWRTAADIS